LASFARYETQRNVGHVKDAVCGNNAHTEDELKESVRNEVLSMSLAEFRRAVNSVHICYV